MSAATAGIPCSREVDVANQPPTSVRDERERYGGRAAPAAQPDENSAFTVFDVDTRDRIARYNGELVVLQIDPDHR